VDFDVHEPISEGITNVTDLSPFFDVGAYLSPHSDIVALMTLEHQAQMVNLMTRAGWDARIADDRVDSAIEELVEYMLFRGEAKLTAPLTGTSGFTEEFAKDGLRDAKGRSLRDFDLKTRMFRYPCSYMIYSEEFDSMPKAVRDRVYRRLGEVLSGADPDQKFAYLSAEDRTAIREILVATKKGLPADWASGGSLPDASGERREPARYGTSRNEASPSVR
jgi:hypothetical protein